MSMQYHIEHYIPERVLLVKVTGNLTVEDLDKMDKDIQQHMRTMQPPIHNIFDISELVSIPTNLRQVTQALKWDWEVTPGWMVIIGGGTKVTLLGLVMNVVNQVIHLPMKTQHTLKDALLFLGRVDPTLTTIIEAELQKFL